MVKEEGTSFEVQIEIYDESKQVHFVFFWFFFRQTLNTLMENGIYKFVMFWRKYK